MYLLSTGRSTIITEYRDLETKVIYQHEGNESIDFQFFPQKRFFVEVNPKSGLEFLRIRDSINQKMEISRVRKMKIENLYCVACPKIGYEEVAIGLTNGEIKLLNYTNSGFIYKFPAEISRSSVVHLDYNSSDEYISSVYENGKINIYGIKTRTKMETVNVDNNTILSRFHPTKRFHLVFASHKGSVHVYEIQTKRKLFTSKECHAAPCRDVCMSSAIPDTIISVGFDCKINIFDIRKKTQPQQITHNHPLSAVALSECGTYFSAGNLKGEIISYDIRNTKSFLKLKKVHECPVSRIAFVPNEAENSISSFSSNCETEITESNNLSRRKSSPGKLEVLAKEQRDSFFDFIDCQTNKGHDKISNRLTLNRDSFDWDALSRKYPLEDNRASLLSSYRIIERNSHNRSRSESPALQFNKDIADSKENMQSSSSEFVNITRRKKRERNEEMSQILPLKDRSNTSLNIDKRLQQIEEENPIAALNSNSSYCGKENAPSDLELGDRFKKLPDDRNSTPNRVDQNSFDILPKSKNTTKAIQNYDFIAQQIENLRSEMNEKFQKLQGEILFNAESNKWQIFNQNCNLWNKQMSSNEDIKDALSILLQTDSFVLEFLRLKEENEMLKAKLHEQVKSDQQ